MEELGKLPMIVGAISQIAEGKEIDWKKLQKRFTTHIAKLESEIRHHYVWAIDICPANTDVAWYNEKIEKVKDIYSKKNQSTYVDVIDNSIVNLIEKISKEDSRKGIEEAFEFLRAHWKSETFTNPKLKTEPVGCHNSGGCAPSA